MKQMKKAQTAKDQKPDTELNKSQGEKVQDRLVPTGESRNKYQ